MSEKSEKEIFISHSSKDNDAVRKIYEALAKNGISCWLDLHDIPPDGGVFAGQITQGINQAKSFLLVLSRASNQSPHVLNEVNLAFNRRLPFIIYNIDLPESEFSDDLKYYLANKQFIKVSSLGEPKALQLMLQVAIKHLNGLPSVHSAIPISPVIEAPVKKPSPLRSVFLFIIMLCLLFYAVFKEEINNMINAEMYHAVTFKAGDLLSLGTYHQEPLIWVYAGGTDGFSRSSKFISRNLIAAKPFNVARSGHYQTDKSGNKDIIQPEMTIMNRLNLYSHRQLTEMYGSSDYANSTLRLWLNSPEKIISYPGQTPNQENINTVDANRYLTPSNLENLNEGGFLQEFSKSDLKMLKKATSRYPVTTENLSKADNRGDRIARIWRSIKLFQETDTIQENNLPLMLNKYQGLDQRNFYYRDIQEYVSIPSLDEVVQIYQNPALDLQYQIEDSDDDMDKNTEHSWWTRTACGYMPYTICTIQPSPTIKQDLMVVPATVSNLIPVRPAITIDVSKIECIGKGTLTTPYTCRKK